MSNAFLQWLQNYQQVPANASPEEVARRNKADNDAVTKLLSANRVDPEVTTTVDDQGGYSTRVAGEWKGDGVEAPLAPKKGSHTTGSAQFDIPLGEALGGRFSAFGDASTKGGLGTRGIRYDRAFGNEGADLGARRAGEYALGDLPSAGPSDAALAEAFNLSEKEKRLMALLNNDGGYVQHLNYGGKAKFLPMMQQQKQSNPLLGALGSAAGTAVGAGIGGPLGGQIGGALGGQLGGTGTIDPYAAGASVVNKNKGQLTDLIGSSIGFATGGQVAPKENLDDVVIQGIKWLGGALSSRNKKLTGKKPGDRKKNLRPEHKMSGGSVGMDKDMVVNGKFMSSHTPNFKEKVGPLSKVIHKAEGGEVHERHYHNPLMPKPSSGGGDK